MTEYGEVDHTYAAIKRSLYARHMAKWLKYFPLEQFHIVSGEGLIENPVPHLKVCVLFYSTTLIIWMPLDIEFMSS